MRYGYTRADRYTDTIPPNGPMIGIYIVLRRRAGARIGKTTKYNIFHFIFRPTLSALILAFAEYKILYSFVNLNEFLCGRFGSCDKFYNRVNMNLVDIGTVFNYRGRY